MDFNEEDHPRDEIGRFTDNSSINYNNLTDSDKVKYDLLEKEKTTIKIINQNTAFNEKESKYYDKNGNLYNEVQPLSDADMTNLKIKLNSQRPYGMPRIEYQQQIGNVIYGQQKFEKEVPANYSIIQNTVEKQNALLYGFGDDIDKYREYRKQEAINREYQNQQDEIKQDKIYRETPFGNINKGSIIDSINSKIETGLHVGKGVYDNDNVYTKYYDNKIKTNPIDAINQGLIKLKDNKNFEVTIDQSHKSEATYISITDKLNENTFDNQFIVRVGSHFKDGVSGNADVHLDYRKYKNTNELKTDFTIISNAILGINNTEKRSITILNNTQFLEMCDELIQILQSETNRAIVHNVRAEVNNGSATIAQGIAEIRDELQGSDRDPNDTGLQDALDYLRETVVESQRAIMKTSKLETRAFVDIKPEVNLREATETLPKEFHIRFAPIVLNRKTKITELDKRTGKLISYYEIITPEFVRNQDWNNVSVLLEHDESKYLTRGNTNAKFEVNDKCVYVDVKCLNTQRHRDAYEETKYGEYAGGSFAFYSNDDIDSKTNIRTVRSGYISEVSLVRNPAYKDTAAIAIEQQIVKSSGENDLTHERQVNDTVKQNVDYIEKKIKEILG
jgi:HK97 family phage prohead protease